MLMVLALSRRLPKLPLDPTQMYMLAADMSWPLGHLVFEAFFSFEEIFFYCYIHLGRSNHQGSSFFWLSKARRLISTPTHSLLSVNPNIWPS
jgi:hypothetical protein